MAHRVLSHRSVLAVALACAGSLSAQFAPNETDEFTPPVAFGFSGIDVVLDGDLAFVGSPNGQFVGSARAVDVYRETGGSWSFEQRLEPPAGFDARFGWSLDFDGTSLIVGAPPLPSGASDGAAIVYTFDGVEWSGVELPLPPGVGGEGFGQDVAIDGNLALVGAPLANGSGRGVAYAYLRNGAGTWLVKQRIVPSVQQVNGAFGISLDIADDHALIGASGAERAFAFRYVPGSLWSQTQILDDFLVDPDNAFGEELALDGARAVVGAWQDGVVGNFGGAFVYELRCGTWETMQALLPPIGSSTYGRAVDIDGDVVVVGAQSTAVGGQNMAGSAYAYRYDGATWQLEETLTAATPNTNDQLGRSVSIDGDRVLVGAPDAGAGGSAFLFDATPIAATFADLGFALAGAGDAPELRGEGTLTPSSALDVVIGCGPASGSGTLVIGLAEIAAPFKGGTLVPAPLALVTGLPLDAVGALTLSSTWPAGIPAGTTVTLQTWFADASGPVGFTSTNALRLTAK